MVTVYCDYRELDDQDVCCSSGVLAPDTYAIVSYAASNFDELKEVGRTSVIDNDNNPVWPQIFTFNVSNNNYDAVSFEFIICERSINFKQ